MNDRFFPIFPRAFLLAAVFGIFLPSATARQAPAAVPARQFLEGLRERGYHDMALEYLDRMATSPLAAGLEETLHYERGVTLIEASRDYQDVATREKLLDQAQASLQRFVGQYPDHELASTANSQLGNVVVERARMKLEQSKAQPDQQAQLINEARKLYDEAYRVFATSENYLREQLATMPKAIPQRDTRQIERRDRLRADYLQAQLLSAAILEETADTAEKGSEEYNELLTKAAANYGMIYEKYRTRIAGLYARMYQGRVHQKMGKLTEALGYYEDLFQLPDSPEAFRTLKTRTMLLAMECWLDESQKRYAEAIRQAGAWVEKARPTDAQDPDWLSLRLSLAKAHHRHAEELEGKNPQDPQAKALRAEARKLAAFVVRYPGEGQREARELLAKLGGPGQPDRKADPATFSEARLAGREALDAVQTANLVLKMVPDRLKQEQDPKIREELQEQLDRARQTVETSEEEALRLFRLALQLADEKTPIDEVNAVRYFLCYLYFSRGDFLDAAVVGEFLARRFPDSSGARQGGQIALASYVRLYAESRLPDRQFEINRIVSIADYIAQRWPTHPEGEQAVNTLIPFMIQLGRLDRAVEYLDRIPVDSPRRGEAELRTGQAMWSSYLRGVQDIRRWEEDGPPAGVEMAAKKAELEPLKEQAQQTLEAGVARMEKSGQVNPTVAAAVLSLAQIYVDTEQAEKAISLLENDRIGALTLVRDKHRAAAREGFAEETYKTSLRAYIAALATTKDSDAMINKAKGIMSSLQEVVGPTQEDQRKLIAIYISLARDLKQQMDLLDSPEAKKSLSRGFETFLRQVGAGSQELNVLHWVAETFYGMGESFDTARALSPEAKRYYGEALAMYQRILDLGGKEPAFLQPPMRIHIRMRLAMTKRRLGQFEAAIDALEAILQENNMLLNVQVEAARTYQEWGAAGNPASFPLAINGGRPDKATNRNIIWGWGRLAQIAGRHPQHRDTFYEARYNLALCRFQQAESQKTAERTELLNLAKRDVTVTARLYPDLGGEKWRPQFDALLRNIQKSMGERPVGLAAVET